MRCLVKKIVIVIICGLFFFLARQNQIYGQTAQEAHVSGSPNPVGSGARALGMGGAFIGVADDATAASWNPGGLMQLERPEVSIVLSYDKLYEDRSFQENPGASGEYSVSLYDINYLSFAYPFKNTNMIVSMNYQTLYNFNKTHNYDYTYRSLTTSNLETALAVVNTTMDLSGPRQTNVETEGYLRALSPAIAIQLTPSFSLGYTFNFFHPNLGSKWETDYFDNLDGTLEFERVTTLKPPLPPTVTTTTVTYSVTQETRYRDEYRFRSSLNPLEVFNKKASYNIGFLWNINRYFTLGGVYKAPFEATVRYKETFATSQVTANKADPDDVVRTKTPLTIIADEKQEMDMPRSYGLGLACRFTDQFTMDLDVYRTDWQDFVLRQASGRELSLITGQERSEANTDPTHQVRLGAEYLFLIKNKYAVPVRAGLFYDPEPTEDKPDDFYGFALGGGIATGSFVFDLAYQYRWGDDVRKVRLGQEEVFQDVEQHTVYASFIYHF